tara:strand:+ start:411 stop:809 length:399 start_codon:yes stop_codon:yes gene_type:complete
MIVIRILEDNSGDEVEQEIYCGDPCYPDFKGYLSKFNIYSDIHTEAAQKIDVSKHLREINEVIGFNNFVDKYPLIKEDFISTDYEDYCINCEKQLNIFDEDMQQFRPRTEADNEIVKSVNFKGQAINFKRLF